MPGFCARLNLVHSPDVARGASLAALQPLRIIGERYILAGENVLLLPTAPALAGIV